MSRTKPVVEIAVEGASDAAIAERLLQEFGFESAQRLFRKLGWRPTMIEMTREA